MDFWLNIEKVQLHLNNNRVASRILSLMCMPQYPNKKLNLHTI
jgi:hypothetical protein